MKLKGRIKVYRSQNADSRTADHVPTIEELSEDSVSHILDVQRGLKAIARMLEQAGKLHDWTKLAYISMFQRDFANDMKRHGYFKGEGEWWPKHIRMERHHLEDSVPEDVNLVDVIEMLVDCVMAGAARSKEGRASYRQPPKGLLEKAYRNTFEMLADSIDVRNDDGTPYEPEK